MPRPDGIDVHAHFFPESFLRLVEEEGGPHGARVDHTPQGPLVSVGGAGVGVPLDSTYWDLDRRVRAMNRHGVQVHALSLTVPMTYWAPPKLGARLARAFNDALVEAHRAYPDRFVGCATLPLQDPAAALVELHRVAALPGIRAVYAGTNVADRDFSDPALFPVLEQCQALKLPLLLHPINVVDRAKRLAPFYLRNTLGNPFDTAVAAAHLIFGGVLDRLPRLEVCLPHGGGAFPYLAGRLEHGQKVRAEARGRARRKVAAYLRRFTYDTITHSPGALRYLVETVGADRVMLGSDYCFDMGYTRPRRIIEALGLRATDRARILRGNAAKLLRVR